MAKVIKGEDYEIIPHQILADLRDEIEAVKKRLITPVGALEKELLSSMTDLKNSLNQLNSLIKSAAQEVSKEEKDGVAVQLKRLNNKIDQVGKQNEQIASALLSVANMVQTTMRRPAAPMPAPRPMPPRPAPMPPKAPPLPPPASRPMGPSAPGEMPPPPGPELPPGAEFEHKKKKGLLGMLFKK